MNKSLSAVAAIFFVLAFACGCAQTRGEVVSSEAASGIKGQVFYADQGAAADVYVYAYNSPFNDLRVPTKLISAPSGPNGSYTLNLPPGSYYIVARKRTTGNPKGYLVRGDYEGKYPANPVTVPPGAYVDVNISIQQLLGAFLAAPYLPTSGDTGVKGTIRDGKGRPVAGAYAMLYTDKEMVGMPAFLSRPTGKDGAYAIYLKEPGTYYVAARMKFGGLPRKGEPYGTYDKNAEHKVALVGREIADNVDVTLAPFPFDLTKPAK